MFEDLIRLLKRHEKRLKSDPETQNKIREEKIKIIEKAQEAFFKHYGATMSRPKDMKYDHAINFLEKGIKFDTSPVASGKTSKDEKVIQSLLENNDVAADMRCELFGQLLGDEPLGDDPSQDLLNNEVVLGSILEMLWLFYVLSATKKISAPVIEAKLDLIAMRVLPVVMMWTTQMRKVGKTKDRLTVAKEKQIKKTEPVKQRIWEIIDEKELKPFKMEWEKLSRQVYEVLNREMQTPPSHRTIIRYAKEKFNVKL